jgi:hypothetical protein
MRRAFQKPRGAASVEAAISMIIIIPIFTYALFMDDLLRYAGDLQEAVVSTPWDFTIQDYTRPGELGLTEDSGGTSEPVGGATLVQRNARRMFCDHESSGDSYNQAQDCDSENHHDGKALSGHVCWLNDNAHQVTCEPVRTNVGDLTDPTFRQYKSRFGNTGGLYECHGRTVVENYLMPKSFLQEFSKEDLSKENWKKKGSSYHGNAQAGDNDTAYYLEQVNFALITDPWALNDRNLQVPAGTKSGQVWERANVAYRNNLGYAPAVAASAAFLASAVSEGLLGVGAFDNPATPNISFPSAGSPTVNVTQDTGSRGYFATPWRTSGTRGPYEDTYDARGDYYMGCTSEEGC